MDLKEKIYETFTNMAKSIGYSDVHGRILAALIVKDGPVSMQDIADETGYSLSSISLSLDLLELVGMVKRIKKKKDRQVYVGLDGDLLEGLKNAVLLKIQKGVNNSLKEFEEYKDLEKDDETKEIIYKLEKEIKRMDKYVKKLSAVDIPE